MKKIALLFIILCTGLLNSMESKKPLPGHYGIGLGNVPSKVLTIIELNNSLVDVIEAIKTESKTDEELKHILNEEHEFTKLVHVLADMFNTSTNNIAKKFATQVAGQYITLGDALIDFVAKKNNNKAINHLIIQGADVNYKTVFNFTPLIIAVRAEADAALIQLLLNAGADPNLKDNQGYTVLDWFNTPLLYGGKPKYVIRDMLKEAMNLK